MNRKRAALNRLKEYIRDSARGRTGSYWTAHRLAEEAISEATGYRFPRPGRCIAVAACLIVFVALLVAVRPT